MLTRRIIPCLDVHEGRVVKGVQFVNLRDMGDPVELGLIYEALGADELVYLDISASVEGRRTFTRAVERIASRLRIPFTVGGGVSTVEDIRRLLEAGADKVSLNTAAVLQPALLSEGAALFGRQCVVLAVDALAERDGYRVYIRGGREKTELEAFSWCRAGEVLGAGEILLTAIGRDGTRQGFDIYLTKKVVEAVNVPVIASGGAGRLEHFLEVFTEGKADAALAAGLFHEGTLTPQQVKLFLKDRGIAVRL
ncbi:MAG: imidazole glycerol phosphate synthase subunit HisF [Bacteroidia bacterium]|nr:imidazole glycerol phosphate synthase subunit HisF [Bacteroidia bacterium]MCX7651848.1 imidazole glycerol phosphate synthase subunit HisF [Bacteroidia bacterium]MDW8416002.1 imidazole glycerol phosphate synthase subunit HisF [Bacteroidia bacterium]